MRKLVYIKPAGRLRFMPLGMGSVIGCYHVTNEFLNAQTYSYERADAIAAWFRGLGVPVSIRNFRPGGKT